MSRNPKLAGLTVLTADVEAERGLLGTLLIGADDNMPRVGWITPGDFQIDRHQAIYRAIVSLVEAGQGANLVTVPDWMRDAGTLGLDDTRYIMELVNEVPSYQYGEHYAQRVRKARRRQALHAVVTEAGKTVVTVNGQDPVLKVRRLLEAVEEDFPDPAAVEFSSTALGFSTMADLDGVLGDITWDWPGWIAPGFAHLIVAEPGVGKSMLALSVAGAYLLGLPWLDGKAFEGQAGSVLWCETEAGHAPNRERAKAWGLPVDCILYPVENPLDSISLQNLRHIATIGQLAQRDDVKLIVVDSFSGGNAKDENDAESGQVVKLLAEIARDTAKPLLVTHHLNKGWRSNRITLTNIRGSTAIAQYVRLIWALDKPDPDKAELRLYAIKSNLAELPDEIGLAIGSKGLTTLAQAPQVPRGETAIDRAIEFLLDTLEREPLAKREIDEMAEGLNISGASLRRAADKLAIVKLKHRDGPWLWSLPAHQDAENLQ